MIFNKWIYGWSFEAWAFDPIFPDQFKFINIQLWLSVDKFFCLSKDQHELLWLLLEKLHVLHHCECTPNLKWYRSKFILEKLDDGIFVNWFKTFFIPSSIYVLLCYQVQKLLFLSFREMHTRPFQRLCLTFSNHQHLWTFLLEVNSNIFLRIGIINGAIFLW